MSRKLPEKTKRGWFKAQIRRILSERGLDWDVDDVFSELYDPTLTQNELMDKIHEYVGKRRQEWTEDQIKAMEREQKEKIRVEELGKAIVDTMIQPIPNKSPIEDEIRKYIQVLWHGRTKHILLISGAAGIGKSHTTRKILRDMGIEYVEVGDPTPEGLYEVGKLFSDQTGKKGVLLLDETTLLEQSKVYPRILHLLNQMGNTTEKRVVARPTKKGQKEGDNERYEFLGKIIILANDTHFVESRTAEATRSRMLICKLHLSKEDYRILLRIVLAAKFGEVNGRVYAATYLMAMRKLAEMLKTGDIIDIATSVEGVRQAIEFAEWSEVHGIEEGVTRLITNVLETTQIYWDAYTMGWAEFSAKYPEVSMSGWKRYRRRVREILSEEKRQEIMQMAKEIAETVADSVIKEGE